MSTFTGSEHPVIPSPLEAEPLTQNADSSLSSKGHFYIGSLEVVWICSIRGSCHGLLIVKKQIRTCVPSPLKQLVYLLPMRRFRALIIVYVCSCRDPLSALRNKSQSPIFSTFQLRTEERAARRKVQKAWFTCFFFLIKWDSSQCAISFVLLSALPQLLSEAWGEI